MENEKNLIIEVPEDVRRILDRLESAGHEAYIVGGCVRDVLLGRTPGDWDITTSALPEEVKGLFQYTADTGIQHGTVMVLCHGAGYEVTTFRIDGDYLDGRHPSEVTFTRSLEEDLKRRDFTINAFAWCPKKTLRPQAAAPESDGTAGGVSAAAPDFSGRETGNEHGPEGRLVDLFGGLEDLGNGVILCVGNPDERFDEDALRIMRAVRFSAQLGFEIEEKTKAAISSHAPKLAAVSRERIRVEFEKTLLSVNPAFVYEYAELGLAPYIFPSAGHIGASEPGTSAGHFDTSEPGSTAGHIGTSEQIPSAGCFDSSGAVLLNTVGADMWVRIRDARLLFGDEEVKRLTEVSKYLMYAAFLRKLNAKEADTFFRSLKYDNRTRETVVKILEHKEDNVLPEPVAVKKELNRLGADIFEMILDLKDAEADAGLIPYTKKPLYLRRVFNRVMKNGEAWSIRQLAVNGKDLIEAGCEPGTAVGETLEKLLAAVIERPELNTKEKLLEIVAEWAAGSSE